MSENGEGEKVKFLSSQASDHSANHPSTQMCPENGTYAEKYSSNQNSPNSASNPNGMLLGVTDSQIRNNFPPAGDRVEETQQPSYDLKMVYDPNAGCADDENDSEFKVSPNTLRNHEFDESTLTEEDETLMYSRQSSTANSLSISRTSEDDSCDEIERLKRESKIPVSELLEKYERNVGKRGSNNIYEQNIQNKRMKIESSDNTDGDGRSEFKRITRGYVSGYSEDNSTGYKYDSDNSGDEDNVKKDVRIGEEYQINVDDRCIQTSVEREYDDKAYDTIVWDPTILKENQTCRYLNKCSKFGLSGVEVKKVPDDEMALRCLMKHEGNWREAIVDFESKDNDFRDPLLDMWSEEDCEKFEEGLKKYNKNFYMIAKEFFNDEAKSNDLVNFYYFWKKSYRGELFLRHNRLGSKKPTNPSVFDYVNVYMDQLGLPLHQFIEANGRFPHYDSQNFPDQNSSNSSQSLSDISQTRSDEDS